MRNLVKTLLKFVAYRLLPKKFYLQLCYFRAFGEFVDFKRPKTLNEKLQWKKLYGYYPVHTIIADKYAVREYVSDRIGDEYLVPLISVLNRASEFELNALPEAFVLKANHGSGHVRIVERG